MVGKWSGYGISMIAQAYLHSTWKQVALVLVPKRSIISLIFFPIRSIITAKMNNSHSRTIADRAG